MKRIHSDWGAALQEAKSESIRECYCSLAAPRWTNLPESTVRSSVTLDLCWYLQLAVFKYETRVWG
ncbi:hypothetical protein I79_007379 [Cricetulus griseus]|uniref:Uncharacterized protein n=1 Tax=Cricetulus griseus TaxID=10029 RepID=G3HAD1_CRIGR|nr:hypothetical protein I79_007379 [Cricetulus griseus]